MKKGRSNSFRTSDLLGMTRVKEPGLEGAGFGHRNLGGSPQPCKLRCGAVVNHRQ